jgi:DNA ligase 1
MLLSDVVSTSAAVAADRSRLAKIEALAACLRRAGPDEVALAVSYLSGEPRQRRTGVGWASLRDLPAPAAEPALRIAEDAAFSRAQALSGSGSSLARREEIERLFARATAEEQRFLSLLLIGELRQGALAGVMADAVARAAGVELAAVRRAAMLAGDLPAVAEAALTGGVDALARFHLRLGQPIQPMLAQTEPTVADALERTGEAAVEWKLDGVRVQVHREGGEVAVFSRSLDLITDRVPEVVEAALALPARSAVLDGEVIALRADGRPRPFQVTGSRVASREDVESIRRAVPLTAFFFDLLHLDGEDLIDEPGSGRFAALASILAAELQVPRLVTADPERAGAFFDGAIGHGHEGVMVKALSSPYEAGRRGTGWIKVKPRHTLDLVVLAAEWGHGRRRGWLSNLHLGARDPATGGWVMLGKTFKGLTDAMLEWQTAELLARETGREGIAVRVRPELVVEVAFDGVQTSPRYPGGMALRFARVLRYRDDKPAGEADTVDMVRALHQAGV